MKKNTHPLITGTILLTGAGLISRIIGFYYRIFLASLIGAEGIGIYQMVFPLYILFVSLSCGGIQTAISKYTAESTIRGNHQSEYTAESAARRNHQYGNKLFFVGISISLLLSLFFSVALFFMANPISACFLKDERTFPILRVMALAIPFEALHSCIMGYYYGRKKPALPAFLQLAEQLIRVLATHLFFRILLQNGGRPSPALAAQGLLAAEVATAFLSLTALVFDPSGHRKQPVQDQKLVKQQGLREALVFQSAAWRKKELSPLTIKQAVTLIGRIALPISCNRLILNLFQSMEAGMVPQQLHYYYHNEALALSTYGCLTGMALPLILFPSAITGSFSLLLMPSISQARAEKNDKKLAALIRSSLFVCLFLGIFFTAAFLLFGKSLGLLLYHNEMVGSYLTVLAWLCPFLYLHAVMSGILHGLGKTTEVFLHSLIGAFVRLICIWFFVPRFGVTGYLWGLLPGQLITTALSLFTLKRIPL